jgi:lipoprotein-releasing system permease protein
VPIPYEWLIGTRYLRSTHRRGFVSFVAIVSVLGLALGVATLIVVLSVMNGFQREIRSRILSVTSHATMIGLEGSLSDWQKIRGEVLKQPGVVAAAPYIEEQAMLANGMHIDGASVRVDAATVRGVLPEEESTTDGLAQRVTEGKLSDLKAGEYNTILGSALAKDLNVTVGGSVVLIAPEGTATPIGVVPRSRRFRVTGILHSGMYEIDRAVALVHMTDAARLFRLDDKVTGLRLALKDPLLAPSTVRKVALALGGNFYIKDWTMDHESFFRSIESMKKIMFIILFMIVGVAAFNIVATLVMIVKEKQTDIAILRTLGAGPPNVLLTFAVQGVLIGLAGTLLGALLGKVLSDHLGAIVGVLEHVFNTQFIDAKVYYISDLPTYVEGSDVLQICGVAFILCALATIYPAWRASRTAPAQALRHE